MKTVKEMIQRYRYKYRSRNVVEVSITPHCTELILVIFILILIPFYKLPFSEDEYPNLDRIRMYRVTEVDYKSTHEASRNDRT